jgi:polar amino acid transport system substrate-binding protein
MERSPWPTMVWPGPPAYTLDGGEQMTLDGPSVGRKRRTRTIAIGMAALAVSMSFAACGGSDTASGGATTDSSAAGPKASADLPEAIRKAGVVRVGADIAYPPLEYLDSDGKTALGVDPDLAKAIGEKLGIEFKMINSAFGGLIPALNSGRIDIIMSFATDTPERQKSVDFIDAYQSGTALMVKKGNPDKIATIEDLCGKSAGVQEGSVQVPIVTEQNKKCTAAGKKPIDLKQLPKDTDVQLLLKGGRISGDLLDSPVAAWVARTSGGGNDFEVVPKERYAIRPHGFAVKKGNDQLRDAVQKALKEVIADGTYDKILAKNDAAEIALKSATINGGTAD